MDETRQWRVFVAVACGAAAVLGLLAGWLSRACGWGFGILAVPVGLLPGVLALVLRDHGRSRQALAALAACGVGLAAFAWASRPPVWRAEEEIADGDLDEQCVQIAALQICYQRKVMGVFDYADVPEPIRQEARHNVAEMSKSERWALCNRTFGDRINADAGGGSRVLARIRATAWAVAVIAAALLPTALQHRNRSPEAG
jgi:hypothetical protein